MNAVKAKLILALWDAYIDLQEHNNVTYCISSVNLMMKWPYNEHSLLVRFVRVLCGVCT